ncbi:MAG: hypothetical protein NTZ67_07660 [Gammaproteobacteria bacterium]|nr:hypothetical protein [Gammaproteobacteria bacterium]
MENALFYESSFNSEKKCAQPDHYVPDLKKVCRPNSDFVISRKADGSILSRYGDDTWLLWPYRNTPRRISALNFLDFPSKIKDDIKWVLFILIYIADIGRVSTLSLGSLAHYMILLKNLGLFSHEKKTTPCEVLGSEFLLRKYVDYLISHGKTFTSFVALLTQLFSIGVKLTGIQVINENTIGDIRILYGYHFKARRQHAVIPTRIYSHLISQYWNTIDIFNDNQEKITRLIKSCIANPAYGRCYMVQRRFGYRIQNYLPSFEEAAKAHKLTELFFKYKVRGVNQLSRFLAQIQYTCKELIHAYSGMRDNEALSLKIDCLHVEKNKRGDIVHLLGETSKLVGQRKTTAWVTSIEIKKAVDVAKSIAKLILDYKGFDPEKTPLFVSVSYFSFTCGEPPILDEISVNHTFDKKRNHAHHLIDCNFIKILDEDIKDLEKIDPFRSWQEEVEFQVGSVWRTTTHQWRRSLAFYVAQSGLVSLPTLKRQLQHITREMTIYYCNGAGFSDLFNNPEHFMHELKKTKPEADALAYIYNVLLSDEPIKGAHGHHLNSNEFLESNKTILLENRKKTVAMFKKGELAYTETALGACTSSGPCDKRLLRSFTACFSCPKAAIKLSKVELLVSRQKQFLNRLDTSSIEYQTEKKELEELLYLQKKINRS